MAVIMIRVIAVGIPTIQKTEARIWRPNGLGGESAVANVASDTGLEFCHSG
jgi:hypothetical protein